MVADDEETAVEEEEEDKEGGGGGGFPKFTVNLPAHVKPPESLIPFVPEEYVQIEGEGRGGEGRERGSQREVIDLFLLLLLIVIL